MEALNPPWEKPSERAGPEPDPGGHLWELVGTKLDEPCASTYYLWGCRGCGGRTVSDGPFRHETANFGTKPSAKNHRPSPSDLRRGLTEEDCTANLVRLVHDR